MRRSTRSLILPLLSLLTATAVHAQDVTIGGAAETTNSFPFTNYHFQTPNRYQQLYTASNFAGPVFIDAIRFANTRSVAGGLPGSIANGDYLIRFAVTSRPENGLTTDFDANVGGSGSTFFSGMFTAGGLRIVGTPYLYDPSLGNLLLDVTVFSQADVGFLGLDFSRSSTDGTSRAYHSFAPPYAVVTDNAGLVTTFETRAVAVVPEPATVLLVATGLTVIGVLHRRRRA